MVCKKNQPGKPCCLTTCYQCAGGFNIEGITIGGTWDTPASGCACLFPATVLFDSLTHLDAAESDCWRETLVNHSYYVPEWCLDDYCDTKLWFVRNEISFGNPPGIFDVNSNLAIIREHQQITARVDLSNSGGSSRATITLTIRWVLDMAWFSCEELDTDSPASYCQEPSAPYGDCIDPTGSETIAWVERVLIFELENLNSANCEDLCGEANLVSQTGTRWTIGTSVSTGDGSIDPPTWDTPLVSGSMNLAVGQRLAIVRRADGVSTSPIYFDEPCWPDAPTVEINCGVAPDPEDPVGEFGLFFVGPDESGINVFNLQFGEGA